MNDLNSILEPSHKKDEKFTLSIHYEDYCNLVNLYDQLSNSKGTIEDPRCFDLDVRLLSLGAVLNKLPWLVPKILEDKKDRSQMNE